MEMVHGNLAVGEDSTTIARHLPFPTFITWMGEENHHWEVQRDLLVIRS